MSIVELEDVAFGYLDGPEVLSGVSLEIAAGEFVAVAGPNGGGKTTLLRLLLGLESPTRGRVRLFGEAPGQLRRRSRIGYLPQRAQAALDAPITVEELVTAGRTALRGIWGPLKADDRARVGELIERLGLAPHARSPIERLSGGQRQRAFIAKALAGEPALLALDEPTSGVDADSQETLAALLDSLRRELGVTLLYVSHEFGAIERYVERLILIRGGVVFDGPPSGLPARWHDPSHEHAHL